MKRLVDSIYVIKAEKGQPNEQNKNEWSTHTLAQTHESSCCGIACMCGWDEARSGGGETKE